MTGSPASRSIVWPGALLVAALALSHPYTGIRHDSILYLGDALARLDPGRYDQDLYFLFGSQGRYTILPTVYAALINVFGVGTGTIVGLVTTQALYLTGTIFFVGAFAPPRARVVCALAVVLGWSLYGGYRVFAYAEPFLTARSFAEPAVLIGLGLLTRGRLGLAVVAIVIAAIFHPLMASGAFLVLLFFQAAFDRRVLVVLPVGALALAVFGWIGFGPFVDVFATYDASWLALAQDSNPQAFILEWQLVDYGIAVYAAVLLVFAARYLEGERVRALTRACLVAGLSATVVSFLAVDVAHSVFFGKLQIWRALWIMQWVAVATLPLTVRALWKRGDGARVAALLLTIGWMAPFSIAPAPVALLALALDRSAGRIRISRSLLHIVVAGTVVAGLVVIGQQLSRAFSASNLSIAGRFVQLLASSVVLFTVLALLARWSARGRWAPRVAVGALLVASLALWDQRPAWTRTVEARPLGAHIWPGLIAPDAKVYWYHDLVAPWLLLGHANYYTTQQGSGAVFSREMVEELERRRKLTGMLEFQEQLCRVVNSLNEKPGACEPDVVVVRNVCAETHVDFVVLQNTLDGTQPLAEFATGIAENGFEKKFYLFRCTSLAAG